MTNCEHDYHFVVVETVTEYSSTDKGNTTKTTNTYELYCQRCGATKKLARKERV